MFGSSLLFPFAVGMMRHDIRPRRDDGFASRRWSCLLHASPLSAEAADYPSGPVKIITQGAAGSGPDVIARLVADKLGHLWQQPVVVVNHPGAGGVTAARVAAGAEPDGYTLYIPTITSFVIMPEVQTKLPFDMGRDFVHIGFVAETPMMIGVSPALGVNSLPGVHRRSRTFGQARCFMPRIAMDRCPT